MQYVVTRNKTFISGAALPQYRRVRKVAGVLQLAGAADTDSLGVVETAIFAAGEQVSVVLRNAQGTVPMVACGPINAGAAAYAAANGKIDATGSVLVGLTNEAASGDNSIIEIIPTSSSLFPSLARANLTQDDLKPYPVKVMDLAVWDAPSTRAVLATGANDDLAVVYGTFLTAAPTVETGDVKAAESARKVGFQFAVPPEYVDGQTLTLRINAGAKTTVADVALTLDAQVSRQAAPTVDICATAAQSINSLVAANKDFVLTPTDVVAGDLLDVVLTIAYHDDATATPVIGVINSIKILADIKG